MRIGLRLALGRMLRARATGTLRVTIAPDASGTLIAELSTKPGWPNGATVTNSQTGTLQLGFFSIPFTIVGDDLVEDTPGTWATYAAMIPAGDVYSVLDVVLTTDADDVTIRIASMSGTATAAAKFLADPAQGQVASSGVLTLGTAWLADDGGSGSDYITVDSVTTSPLGGYYEALFPNAGGEIAAVGGTFAGYADTYVRGYRDGSDFVVEVWGTEVARLDCSGMVSIYLWYSAFLLDNGLLACRVEDPDTGTVVSSDVDISGQPALPQPRWTRLGGGLAKASEITQFLTSNNMGFVACANYDAGDDSVTFTENGTKGAIFAKTIMPDQTALGAYMAANLPGSPGADPIALSPAAMWGAYSGGSDMYQDDGAVTPATADSDPVAYMEDLSGNAHHITTSINGERPILSDTNGYVTADRSDDRLGAAALPATTGEMAVATSSGAAVYGVDVSAGALDIVRTRMPGANFIGAALFSSALSETEKVQTRHFYEAQGAGDFGTITNFSTYWRDWDFLISFPLIDTSLATNIAQSWFGCSRLVSFPLIDTSSAVNLSYAWFGCPSLISFPLIDTSSAENLSFAWYVCSGLISFPAIDTSAATNLEQAWFGCTSLVAFPAIDTSAAMNLSHSWYNCLLLADFPANMFDSCPGNNFTNAFVNTNLTEASIDGILASLVTAGQSNGTFNQSGGSAPSAAGEASIDILIGRGWTVTVTGGYAPSAPAFTAQPTFDAPQYYLVDSTATIDLGTGPAGTTATVESFTLDSVDKSGELSSLTWDTTGESPGLIELQTRLTDDVTGLFTLSNVVTADLIDEPAQMTAPSLVVDGDTQITATLAADPDDGGSAITQRDLRYSTDETNWTTSLGITSPVTLTGLTASTLYYVQTRVSNIGANGPWSTSASATTSAASSGEPTFDSTSYNDTTKVLDTTVTEDSGAATLVWATADPSEDPTYTTGGGWSGTTYETGSYAVTSGSNSDTISITSTTPDGARELTFYAYDASNNLSAVQRIAITVSNASTGPELTDSDSATGNATQWETTAFDVTSGDEFLVGVWLNNGSSASAYPTMNSVTIGNQSRSYGTGTSLTLVRSVISGRKQMGVYRFTAGSTASTQTLQVDSPDTMRGRISHVIKLGNSENSVDADGSPGTSSSGTSRAFSATGLTIGGTIFYFNCLGGAMGGTSGDGGTFGADVDAEFAGISTGASTSTDMEARVGYETVEATSESATANWENSGNNTGIYVATIEV